MSHAKSLRYFVILAFLFAACALVAQEAKVRVNVTPALGVYNNGLASQLHMFLGNAGENAPETQGGGSGSKGQESGDVKGGGRLEIKGVKGSDEVYLNGVGKEFRVGTVKDTQTNNLVLPPGNQHVILMDPNGDKQIYSGYVVIKTGQKATLHVDKSDSYYEAWAGGPAMPIMANGSMTGTSATENAGSMGATPVSYQVTGPKLVPCRGKAALELAGPPGYAVLKVDNQIVSKHLPSTGTVEVDPGMDGMTYRVEWFSRWGVYLSDPQTIAVDKNPRVTLTAPAQVARYHRIGERVVEDPTINLHWTAKNADRVRIDPLGQAMSGEEGDVPVKFMPGNYDPAKGALYTITATNDCGGVATEIATARWDPVFDPEVVAQALPPVLPKTGSPLPLIALLGFGSMLSGLALRLFRKG